MLITDYCTATAMILTSSRVESALRVKQSSRNDPAAGSVAMPASVMLLEFSTKPDSIVSRGAIDYVRELIIVLQETAVPTCVVVDVFDNGLRQHQITPSRHAL